ncbi:MAG: hypothetical protein HZA17_04490 [Nitrospirae bacterium]|nr:hypothetical protein [Nitrospirota bacterium]
MKVVQVMGKMSGLGKYLTVVICIVLLFPSIGMALDTGGIPPDFTVLTVDGKEISYVRDLKGKKPVYLIFWATW